MTGMGGGAMSMGRELLACWEPPVRLWLLVCWEGNDTQGDRYSLVVGVSVRACITGE